MSNHQQQPQPQQPDPLQVPVQVGQTRIRFTVKMTVTDANGVDRKETFEADGLSNEEFVQAVAAKLRQHVAETGARDVGEAAASQYYVRGVPG